MEGFIAKLMMTSGVFFSEIGGIQFSSSIETQNIRSGPGNSLEVASPVGHLKLSGPQKVDLASFGGSVDIFGLQDITLGTKGQGKVSLFITLRKIQEIMQIIFRSH